MTRTAQRLAFVASAITLVPPVHATSVPRVWNEACLQAIRVDFPAPTVHARNLFHVSVAMYDAWAAYDSTAVGYMHNESPTVPDIERAREEAVSYAGYRVLSSRYARSVNAAETLLSLDEQLVALGFDPRADSTVGDAPAAVGNRCAAAVLAYGTSDGANEQNGYVDTTGYAPVNLPLILQLAGAGSVAAPNHWQPLAFDIAFTQNDLEAAEVQSFVGAHWGDVRPFALTGPTVQGVHLDLDPGLPPQLGGPGDPEFKQNILEVIRFSSLLAPGGGGVIDGSPGIRGNNPLGTNDGTGHSRNPATGLSYAPNPMNHGDYGRVVAEFWADGPNSETPPGHWNVLANEISNHPKFKRRLGGQKPALPQMEWEVKLYLALNGALHDAAIAAWGCKTFYDYVRPITSIRYMGGLGQSDDQSLPSYHPYGLPLEIGLVELITLESSALGQRHAHLASQVGRIAIRTWQGEPENPETEAGDIGWILATDWLPYQRSTFVTPAFAGYVSGHSTFSRAAAEVLTVFTGSPFFPGGMGQHTVPTGGLEFEAGPESPVTLQWATYYDAADEAGLSRLYGGIHVSADDGPGRVLGSKIGIAAASKALRLFDTSPLDTIVPEIQLNGAGRSVALSWPAISGYRYQVQALDTSKDWVDLSGVETATTSMPLSFTDGPPLPRDRIYRVRRLSPAPD